MTWADPIATVRGIVAAANGRRDMVVPVTLLLALCDEIATARYGTCNPQAQGTMSTDADATDNPAQGTQTVDRRGGGGDSRGEGPRAIAEGNRAAVRSLDRLRVPDRSQPAAP